MSRQILIKTSGLSTTPLPETGLKLAKRVYGARLTKIETYIVLHADGERHDLTVIHLTDKRRQTSPRVRQRRKKANRDRT